MSDNYIIAKFILQKKHPPIKKTPSGIFCFFMISPALPTY